MPAVKIEKLGILAGGGDMPRYMREACAAQGTECFTIALNDDAEGDVHLPVGKVGAILKAFRERDVRDLVLIGTLSKPSLKALKPDMKAMMFLARYGYKALGDDKLLRSLKVFLEDEGFLIHGAHRFLPQFLTGLDVLGQVGIDGFQDDIDVGVAAALEWGARDEGQSVIVKDGHVVAREGRAGTDAMIRAHGVAGGVLVKMCKPQQDVDLDLPTIGLRTVVNAVDVGLAGIAVHTGASFFLDQAEALTFADQAGMFVVGVERPYDG